MSSLHLVHFSPTQTTARVLQAIARGMAQSATELDIAHQIDATKEFAQNEVVVVGVPVYGGRVPALAAQRLAHLRGNGTPAVAVVVYGNRAYEDALLELQQLLTAQGFEVMAAAAFIGEHSSPPPSCPLPSIDRMQRIWPRRPPLVRLSHSGWPLASTSTTHWPCREIAPTRNAAPPRA